MGPADLAETLNGLSMYRPENLLVGFETSDDAGIFDLGSGIYLVQTVDFITPVVNDPHTFGRISALNSMSDVYAMGGLPVTALSVLLYNCSVGSEVIRGMMQGAADEFAAAKCALSGGHTVDDHEIKMGFSVTGTITDGRIYRNVGLREGDLLIYTKKLGIGLMTTAIKAEKASAEDEAEVTEMMLRSNAKAASVMKNFDVSACTDVTGFGLAGHAFEMAYGSGVTIQIESEKVPVMQGAYEYAKNFIIPGGAFSNVEFLGERCSYQHKQDNAYITLFDPQTSGGLLMGISEQEAPALLKALADEGVESAVIGQTVPKSKHDIIIN